MFLEFDDIYDLSKKSEKKLKMFVSDKDRYKERESTKYKSIDYVNNVINIISCVFAIYFVNGMYILLPLYFIAIDIILTFLDNLIFHIVPILKYKTTFFSLKNMIKEKENSLKNIEDVKKELEKYECRSGYCSTNLSCDTCNNLREKAKKKIIKLNQYSQFLDEKISEKSNVKPEITKIDDGVKKLQETKQLELIDIIKSLEFKNKEYPIVNSVIENLNMLKGILDETPEKSIYLSKTFYIYLRELIQVLSDLTSVDVSLKDKYLAQLKGIITELNNYIENLKERIINNSVRDITVNMNVLFTELQKENQKLVDGNEVENNVEG